MTMTLVFSMGCRVLVPLPHHTEPCKKAAVFIWLLGFFWGGGGLDGALSRVLTSVCVLLKFCLSALSCRLRFQLWKAWMDLD